MENQISIIVPVYNLEGYIERTLRSILKQSYRSIEVLVVDDGSSDNSWNVIQRIAAQDSRIIPIHQKNGGVTSARLNGVSQAKGEWIGFVDGDDEVEPDMYEILIQNAMRYHADISHCGYQMVFPDGRVNYFHNTGRLMQQDKQAGLRDLLDGSVVEPGLCNKLFRRTLFCKLIHEAPLDTAIKINEDLLMNYYLFSESDLSVFKDVCKYHYIVRQESASRQKLNKHKIYDPIRVKEKILQEAPVQIQADAEKALVSTCLNTYHSLIIAGTKQYKEDLKVVRKILIKYKTMSKRLPKKRYSMLKLSIWMPKIYHVIYKFYAKKLRVNLYE